MAICTVIGRINFPIRFFPNFRPRKWFFLWSADERIFEELHDATTSGHLGVKKTNALLALLYYWPGMLKDVALHVESYPTCQ